MENLRIIALIPPAFAGFPSAGITLSFITLPKSVHLVDHRIVE